MTPLGRFRRWVLLDGSRLHVTAVALGAVYLLLGPVGHFVLRQSPTTVTHGETFVPLLTTFVSGDFLLVSIVVSVNSLFITQEQTPLGQQLDRIEAVTEFRREFEDLVDEPISPAEPTRFVQLVTAAILSEVQALTDGDRTGDHAAEIARFTEALSEQTARVSDALDEGEATLDVVLATLEYDYSAQVNGLRRLRSEYGDAFTETERDRIERVLELLRHFVTAREYFKTVTLSREFANLSNHLMYLSLPVITVVSFALLHDSAIPGRHDVTTLLVVLALAPFFLLAAYAVRVATIARLTRAAGQFVVEERTGR